jgi:glyoxylase-like metal-dependent hydrolase (beta-lactamase superfamily II)
LLTHQDSDHVGSLHALKESTGAEVSALDIEIPYIDGRLAPVKSPPPEVLERMPEFKAMLEKRKPTAVDIALHDGQVLPIAGGVKVIATPGHTPGHMSLYLIRSKTLITGDAMVSEGGQLQGPMEQATPDMESANRSVKKLAALDVETIVCYHGGLVTDDANGQLKRVAGATD